MFSSYQPPHDQRETWKKTHFDHREDNANRTEHRLGQRNASDFLRDIQRLDGHIQRGEDNLSTFLSSSVGFHRFKARAAVKGEKGAGKNRL